MPAPVSEQPRLLFCAFDVVPAPSAMSRRLTEYLRAVGDSFQTVVLTIKTPDHSHIEKYHGARLLRVPVGAGDLPSKVQAFERAVKRQVESEEYLAVHFFDPFGGYVLCEMKGELGFKVIYDATAFPSAEWPLRHPALAENRRFLARARRQELFCLMNADAVIVGSQVTRAWVSGMGVEDTVVHLVPPPVDLTPYTPDVMGRPDASPMKLVHLGSAHDGHALREVMEAMRLALQSVDARLTVVGPREPEEQARLEHHARELALVGKFELQEPVTHDDIHKILATADVGLASITDGERAQVMGVGLSRVTEYLAAGRPVLATDLPLARELVPEGAGLFWAPGDVAGLAQAIVTLARDPERRRAMGEVARTAAEGRVGRWLQRALLAAYRTATGRDDLGTHQPEEGAHGDAADATQMGAVPGSPEPADVTQVGVAIPVAAEEREPTDPALVAPRKEGDTDRALLADRPAVVGTPLREVTPVGPSPFPVEPAREPREFTPIGPTPFSAEGPTTDPSGLVPPSPSVMGTPLPEAPPPAESTAAHRFDGEVRPAVGPSVPLATPPDDLREAEAAFASTDPAGRTAPAPTVMGTPLSETGTPPAAGPWEETTGAGVAAAPSGFDVLNEPADDGTTTDSLPPLAGPPPGVDAGPATASLGPSDTAGRADVAGLAPAVTAPDLPGPQSTVADEAALTQDRVDAPAPVSPPEEAAPRMGPASAVEAAEGVPQSALESTAPAAPSGAQRGPVSEGVPTSPQGASAPFDRGTPDSAPPSQVVARPEETGAAAVAIQAEAQPREALPAPLPQPDAVPTPAEASPTSAVASAATASLPGAPQEHSSGAESASTSPMPATSAPTPLDSGSGAPSALATPLASAGAVTDLGTANQAPQPTAGPTVPTAGSQPAAQGVLTAVPTASTAGQASTSTTGSPDAAGAPSTAPFIPFSMPAAPISTASLPSAVAFGTGSAAQASSELSAAPVAPTLAAPAPFVPFAAAPGPGSVAQASSQLSAAPVAPGVTAPAPFVPFAAAPGAPQASSQLSAAPVAPTVTAPAPFVPFAAAPGPGSTAQASSPLPAAPVAPTVTAPAPFVPFAAAPGPGSTAQASSQLPATPVAPGVTAPAPFVPFAAAPGAPQASSQLSAAPVAPSPAAPAPFVPFAAAPTSSGAPFIPFSAPPLPAASGPIAPLAAAPALPLPALPGEPPPIALGVLVPPILRPVAAPPPSEPPVVVGVVVPPILAFVSPAPGPVPAASIPEGRRVTAVGMASPVAPEPVRPARRATPLRGTAAARPLGFDHAGGHGPGLDDIEEISGDEVMEVSDDPQVMEVEELQAQSVETATSPPPSALDPWLAQMVHGYCPPESHLFDRHVPPTTMPGRDT